LSIKILNIQGFAKLRLPNPSEIQLSFFEKTAFGIYEEGEQMQSTAAAGFPERKNPFDSGILFTFASFAPQRSKTQGSQHDCWWFQRSAYEQQPQGLHLFGQPPGHCARCILSTIKKYQQADKP
jgi:hypothetical protein